MLLSWSQSNIEGLTEKKFNKAQSLTFNELLTKNAQDKSWCEVFLTINASINNYTENSDYIKGLINQLDDTTATKLTGTSRLIVWDRIISGDIIFEGKGLVIENDIYQLSGRANQILQNLTKKNFGYVNINSTKEDLQLLKAKWLKHIDNEKIPEYDKPTYENASIPEISSLKAFEALVVSLEPNKKKTAITKNCLKNIYGLDSMPEDKKSSARLCNPDSYTLGYLAMLIGVEKMSDEMDNKWWIKFWDENKSSLKWNTNKGHFE